jgi:hypothetical protein
VETAKMIPVRQATGWRAGDTTRSDNKATADQLVGKGLKPYRQAVPGAT